MRINYGAGKRRFAGMIFVTITFLSYACAAENSLEQKSVNEIEPAAKSAANEKSAIGAAGEGVIHESASDTSGLYSVECGQVNDAGEPFCFVDGDTYIGWRTYHGFCHVCHAQDAVGSTFAPNLLDRMNEPDMTRDLFVERLNEGFTGQVGVMPPWKDNPNVRKRYNELYAYLMARASGTLPPGRPKKKPKSN